MNRMNILVTGGAGFIGSHLVDHLIAQGHTVTIVDDLSTGQRDYLNPKALFHEGTITDRTFLERIFSERSFDRICHLAAQKSVTKSVSDPLLDAHTNIIGTLTLLEAARSCGVNQLVFASTAGAMYGDDAVVPSDELTEAKPLSPYGISKYSTERYFDFYETLGMKLQILRFTNVYGPRQDPYGEAGVVAIFSKNLVNKRPLVIYGDGEQSRDFIYVADIVLAITAALQSERSGLWNVGTGIETSVNKIAASLISVAKEAGLSEQPIQHVAPRHGELRRSCPKIDKIKSDLGWEPSYSLDRGLEETLRSFQ